MRKISKKRKSNRLWAGIFCAVLCFMVLNGCGVAENKVQDLLHGVGDLIKAEPTPDQPVSTDSSQTVASSPAPTMVKPPESGQNTAEAGESGTAGRDDAQAASGSGKNTAVITGKEYLTGEWGTDRPENHNITSAWLNSFSTELTAKPVLAALLVKDGSIVYEYYREGGNTDTLFNLYSCTKSITSAAVGIAIDQGLIAGVDSRLEDFFPRLADPKKKEITVEHLLNLTSGIEWVESVAGGSMVDWLLAENQVNYVLNQRMLHQPGEVFGYSSGNSHLLSAILQQTTGMTEAEYVKENILEPIGVGEVVWWADSQGLSYGGFGVSMTVRDAARFGQLYLNEGQWGDRQLIPREWVWASTKAQGPTTYYGYNWWIDIPEPDQPFRLYYASGLGGQYIFVVPEYELVAVVTSLGVDDLSVIELVKKHLFDIH